LATPKIGVLGIPFCVGWVGEGIAEAPKALRDSGLIPQLASVGLELSDLGDVKCTLPARDLSNPKLLNPARVVTLCKAIAPRVAEIVRSGYFPLIFGGEDGILMGIIAGLQEGLEKRIGLIYMDAHGDFNTPETTPSGLIGGMNVAMVAGRGPQEFTTIFGKKPQLPEESIVLFGQRNLDPPERAALDNSKVTVISTEKIKEMGATEAMKEAIQTLKPHVDLLYVHMDVDVLDPKEMSALILPVADGLTQKECRDAFEVVAKSGILCGAALMVFNARKDPAKSEAPKVISLARHLVQSLKNESSAM
jgi:arginase